MTITRLPPVHRLCIEIRKHFYTKRIVGQFCVHFLSNCTVVIAVNASSPVVGSSRNNMFGSIINSIPMSVLFLSPPLTPLLYSVPTWQETHGWSITANHDRNVHAMYPCIGAFTEPKLFYDSLYSPLLVLHWYWQWQAKRCRKIQVLLNCQCAH